jgi:hypothetical protein
MMEKNASAVGDMTEAPATNPPSASTRQGILRRIATFLAVALCIGVFMRFMSGRLQQNTGPAGFRQGVLQGALMPCALPNLLVGNDVIIYAANNTGVPYKLGYTVGVNGCGAIFFGFFFWRVSRWKKR